MIRHAAIGVMLLLAGCAQEGLSGLPADQQADARRIEAYFAGLGPMEARVTQAWPDGALSTGVLDYAPGKMRVVYGQPHPMKMVAARGHIVIADGGTGSVTTLSLARNPLGLLLRVPFRFDHGVQVTSVQRGAETLQASVSEADNPSQGRLTLQFTDRAGALSLIGLNGVDARGHELVLHFDGWRQVPEFPDEVFADPG